MKTKDTRKFTDVMDSIRNSEKDKDRFLEAANLERHEKCSNRLSAEHKMTLLLALIGCAFFLTVYAFMLYH